MPKSRLTTYTAGDLATYIRGDRYRNMRFQNFCSNDLHIEKTDCPAILSALAASKFMERECPSELQEIVNYLAEKFPGDDIFNTPFRTENAGSLLPLEQAVFNRHFHAVKAFLEKGADPFEEDGKQRSAYKTVIRKDYLNVAIKTLVLEACLFNKVATMLNELKGVEDLRGGYSPKEFREAIAFVYHDYMYDNHPTLPKILRHGGSAILSERILALTQDYPPLQNLLRQLPSLGLTERVPLKRLMGRNTEESSPSSACFSSSDTPSTPSPHVLTSSGHTGLLPLHEDMLSAPLSTSAATPPTTQTNGGQFHDLS